MIKHLEWDSEFLHRPVFSTNKLSEIHFDDPKALFYLRLSKQNSELASDLRGMNASLIRTVMHVGLALKNIAYEGDSVLRSLGQEDKQYLLEKAAANFHYSRFHEDIQVSNEIAEKRQMRFISELFNDSATTTRVLWKNGPAGFINYSINGNDATLNLGGCLGNNGPLFPTLINSVLVELKDAGVKRVLTEISSANAAVVSYYLRLANFTLIDVFRDFNIEKKFLPRD